MPHYAWVIAFTGTLVLILSHGFGRMSYSVILGSMKDGLSLSYTQIGLIGTGNFIGYLCLAVIGGFLAARFGARKVLFISLLVMGISLFLTGLADSFSLAFLMRLITGMGNGGSYIPMMALPAAWFAAQKRGLATGIVTLGTGIGLSITGLILPYYISLYGHQGWRYAWCLLGVIVFVFSFVCYAFLRDVPAEKGLTMYGGGRQEQKRGGKFSIFSAWKEVVMEKEIWKLGCVYFMNGFSYIIYLTFIIAYLTKEIGLTPKVAGGIFAVLGFFAIFCGVIWGTISDVIGRRYASMFAYIVLGLSSLLAVCWKTPAGLYVSAILFGLTAFAVPVIMAAASGDAVGGRLAPAALGFITLFFGIGQALGPAVAGWLRDATGTFTGAFILSACVSVVGAGASLMLRKKEAYNPELAISQGTADSAAVAVQEAQG
jgi:sugar phosphate permease